MGYPTQTEPVEDPLNQDNLQPPYQCKTCGKIFAIPARLQRHYRVHTGEKPFKCDFCDKMFSVKENLNVHRRIHTKERPYNCTICNRAFEHSGKLHRHMRTHTGERPHKCELCGKTFVQSGQLVIHMRAHTGEKPYTCDYCQKGFTCSKQLKVHIRTHTGEKPYECDICGKTFGYNHVLKMHKMSHLGEKLYKCTLCEEFFNSRKMLDKHIKDHNQETSSRSPESIHEPEYQNNEDLGATSSPSSSLPIPQGTTRTMFKEKSNQAMKIGEFYDQPREYPSPRIGEPNHRNYGPMNLPLTPPRSPDSDLPTYNLSFNNLSISPTNRNPVQNWKRHSRDFMENYNSLSPKLQNDRSNSKKYPEFALFTTVTGERLACPVDLIVRLEGSATSFNSDSNIHHEFQETLKAQHELRERLKIEESRKQKEMVFCDSVLKVLKSCIGEDKMRYLGYPTATIDEVIMNTLKLMNTQSCWEPSLSPMDRIKVNLRLLLECCIPQKDLWDKFGWKGKSIEEIVSEFLKQC